MIAHDLSCDKSTPLACFEKAGVAAFPAPTASSRPPVNRRVRLAWLVVRPAVEEAAYRFPVLSPRQASVCLPGGPGAQVSLPSTHRAWRQGHACELFVACRTLKAISPVAAVGSLCGGAMQRRWCGQGVGEATGRGIYNRGRPRRENPAPGRAHRPRWGPSSPGGPVSQKVRPIPLTRTCIMARASRACQGEALPLRRRGMTPLPAFFRAEERWLAP